MEFKDFMRMIKNMVIGKAESGIYYTDENKENIDKFIAKGYFINGRFGTERTLIFTKKLIVAVKNRGKKNG